MTHAAPLRCLIAAGLATSFGQAARAASESVVYAFPGAVAATPVGGLVGDNSGNLYGANTSGGAGSCGTIFAISPPNSGAPAGTFTVLHNFIGTTDGCSPAATLTRAPNGTLYGATDGSGPGNAGTVFSLSPPLPGQSAWNFAVLHSFNSDGLPLPIGTLYLAPTGALYGTTLAGGHYKGGLVYRLTPPHPGATAWNYRVIYEFPVHSSAGYQPNAGVIGDATGALYGTTTLDNGYHGSGTIFKLTPPATGQTAWTETTLYNFSPSPDGTDPFAELVEDAAGNLYGTAHNNGNATSGGTVFELSPPAASQTPWTYSVLFAFNASPQRSSTGWGPSAPLLPDGQGGFYSTTSAGGTGNLGTVFHLTPPTAGQTAWTETLLHSFQDNARDGFNPTGGKLLLDRGTLIGMTTQGPASTGPFGYGYGAVYKLHP